MQDSYIIFRTIPCNCFIAGVIPGDCFVTGVNPGDCSQLRAFRTAPYISMIST